MKENYNINLDTNQQEKIKLLLDSENYKFWLAGFIEGEGSLVISITKNPKLKYGFALQPEFNVTQHVSGINTLYSFKYLFNGLGGVYKKSGSDNVYVYTIKGSKNIVKTVLPFYTSYVMEYSSKYKLNTFNDFSYVVNTLYESNTQSMDKVKYISLIKLVYSFNPEGKGKQRKRKLEDLIEEIEKL